MNVVVQRIEPGAMRRTLGRFTTGVTVVTTARGGDVHAMTANAFTSVSLDPPLVLVSVDHRTRMHAVLPDTRRYGVSVLASDRERVARHFAGRPLREPGDHTLYLGRVEHLHSRPGEPLVFHAGAFGRLTAEEHVLAHSWGW
jgi:flavin reductase (DIM6/NTAB) family NADH-FMN oxidoreductase RutF